MWSWFTFWLILHVLAILVAFGPTFALPIVGALSRKHPEHAMFGVELAEIVERRLTLPLAVVVPFLGLALIYTAHIQLWKSEWLLISIGLYMVAFFFAILVQNPNTGKMLRAMRAMPPGPPPEGAAPPAEIVALGKRLQQGGMFLTLMIVTILVLMIWRPGNCVVVC